MPAILNSEHLVIAGRRMHLQVLLTFAAPQVLARYSWNPSRSGSPLSGHKGLAKDLGADLRSTFIQQDLANSTAQLSGHLAQLLGSSC